MKTLLLMRHAKSSWKNSSLTDFERPLNRRGRNAAPLMGQHIAAALGTPDAILTSPATRAATTARVVAVECGFQLTSIRYEGLVYDGGLEDIVTLLSGLDESISTCVVVGHNPDLTLLANSLFGANIENVPTAGVVCGTFDCRSWDDVPATQGRLSYFEYPKKLDPEQ